MSDGPCRFGQVLTSRNEHMIAAKERRTAALQRYYFPIVHNGETQADHVGELFGSTELAVQYGARVARDIASDPEYDPNAGTVVIVRDDSGAEVARREVRASVTTARQHTQVSTVQLSKPALHVYRRHWISTETWDSISCRQCSFHSPRLQRFSVLVLVPEITPA